MDEICWISYANEAICIWNLPDFRAWNPPNFMHEIHRISWNLPNFMNLPDFMKSAEFHAWNLPDFMKSTEFHEIHQISWNPPNFMHEIRRISWNSLDFMKSAGFHVFPKWAKDRWSYFCRCLEVYKNVLNICSGSQWSWFVLHVHKSQRGAQIRSRPHCHSPAGKSWLTARLKS